MNDEQRDEFLHDLDKLSYEERIEILTEFQNSRGWRLVKKVMKDNKAYLKEALLTGKDPEDGADMTQEQTVRTRDKLSFLNDLLNTPETFIERLKESKESEDEDGRLDPYYTDSDEMYKDESNDWFTSA